MTMQLKFLQTILEAQDSDFKIAGLSWSPNNQKLAIATSDRQILLFDEKGEKRDKFSTKPYDPEAGKRSYIITGIAFSPDSTKIAVAQSDCIVYVYKIGEKWGEKKAICNKFPQPSPVTCIIWLLTGPIICGLVDGKVRALQTKSNKSQSLFASDSLVVSLASNPKGTGFLSGHVDGNVIRFFITNDHNDDEAQGRVALHSVPPYGLAWTQGHIFMAGCDKRVSVVNNLGKNVKTFDYSKDGSERDFTVACCSPSGQAVAIGSFSRLRLYTWSTRKTIWEETTPKELTDFYTITALAWKRDGSKVTCGGLCGAVFMFESVLKRIVWKDKFEITYVGPSQVLVKPLDTNERGVILRSQYGGEIEDVKIMGKDCYLVARTEETLLVADLLRNLLSEVPWNNSGHNEKFYFENANVCLVFNAGELTLIEYGDNDVLCSVRTEFTNPHLISVRLNERNQTTDNKKLSYLLDLKTICIIDLVSGVMLAQIGHDSKIDWLELNEMGNKLLFRDKKQRLVLIDVITQLKQTIFTGVSFVQWVESSDVAVAQSGTNLAIWYNIDLPENPTLMTVKGDVIDIVRNNGKTEAICVDGNNSFNVELDEGLVEFGTALNDNDYNRAILFLESMNNTSEAEAMWHTLYLIAMKQQNLKLAERCSTALKEVATAYFLHETSKEAQSFVEKYKETSNNSPEVWARLSILYGDLNTAENIYLEQGNIEKALDMYKKLHKWDEALRLADQRSYEHVKELKEEHMSLLMQSGQYEKVGQVLENEGKSEEALNMYLKSNKLLRIPNLLSKYPQLLNDHSVIGGVLKSLIKQELYEPAAEIYEKLDKPDLAMECFRKGKVWNKAVDLARTVSPEKVVQLEEEWGDSLVESKQMDAAISHYIEAGCMLKALNAAVSARQWKKAVHIIKVIDDADTVKKYYEIIAEHFASVKEYSTAEKLYAACGMYKEAVDMYNEAGQWEKAHAIASEHLDTEEVYDMYIKHAEALEEAGKYREAEKLYLSVNTPDLAIAMYKRVEQYDNMVRLVERYHPNLLQTTHLHLGQQLESQGKYRAAEIHFLAINEWKAAMNMYRTLGMWEEAYRVAKQNGGPNAANQVAFLWARTLHIDSAIKLLNKYGILEPCINYACETYQFEFAFQLCKNLPNKVSEVHLKYAMALEDDGKYAEAESEFIQAAKPKEAILMYVHAQNWINALRIAEKHEPDAVPEVLQAQAGQCFKDKQFSEFEVLLLRAQAPELIVQKYKSEDMWIDALRVCKDYLPHRYPSLQSEYSSSHHNQMTDINIETLLSRANEWALAGQHKQAVDCLLQVNTSITEPSIVKRALLRAADMVNKFLFGDEALEVIKVLSPRLIEIGEHNVAAQLYASMEMIKEAIDAFIVAEEWNKARKVAKELDPAFENYVETKYKDRLLKKGDVEQLADVDIIGALDLLAEQGQWSRCIEKAKSHTAPILHKYVALYAAKLLKDQLVTEALQLYFTHGAPAMPQNFNIYNHIATKMFGANFMSDPDSYGTWEQLRQVMFEINENLEVAINVNPETKVHFRNLLLVSHFYALRSACRQVPSLKVIAVKISTAILRYTDFIPADKAFYEAGKDLKEEGRLSEAFVFLNHYLDLCEAIEEDEGQLVDHSDLVQTDFPSNIPLPHQLYLIEDPKEHDNIKEWVLAISMDQKIEQALPVDDRDLYESSLQPGETPCLITGYPVRKQAITFAKTNLQANKDAWNKLNMGAKMAPDSNVASAISFIVKWCGPPS
ncbi:intraflagellar transport protein 172 homolog [Diabrotica virgifera virgifera]|uniref:IFT80/172/WDR35 TPR domain-containing protein n=2 Tax=Diabrotica virgifera virgifera TaxID=50390 RepID=A0ABM5L4J3_DIAVI|nr:intraflagellar transport protein 172 homolog [Diabrotica virgifera virgifera]